MATESIGLVTRRNMGRLTTGIWLPIAVVLTLVIFFAFASEAFLTLRNLTAISGQASTLLLACLGATFVILMGSIDLSVGAMVLLVGAITVTAINAFHLGVSAVFVGILVGALLGTANGLVFAFGVIPSFVVTLGSLSVFTGLAWELLQGRALRFDSIPFEDLAIGQFIPRLPNIALWALIAWGIMALVCFKTRFGRYMYIIGGGEAVAKTSGIPVKRYKVYAFMISGLTAGLAGALAVARLGAAGPTLGTDLLLNTLAAIVVGGTSLSGGVGGVHRTLIGVLIIALLDNGLNLMGVNQYMQMVIKGLVVIAAVLIGQDRSKTTVVK
jgi:ribose/xylose/arabinose/galactoside ABC-type transport system permease subunit